MADAFDGLQRAAFEGLEFPVSEIKVRCSMRHFVHYYLRVPGGVVEKLERGLYEVTMTAHFDTNIKGYGQLWPNVLMAIRQKFEQGITAPLVIPNIGTMKAFMPEWEQVTDLGKVRSGERVPLKWLEDQNDLFLDDAAANVALDTVTSAQKRLAQVLAAPPQKKVRYPICPADFVLTPEDRNLFDILQSRVNAVLALLDQAELAMGLIASKIAGVTALVKHIDRKVKALQHPANYAILRALQDLWDALMRLGGGGAKIDSPTGTSQAGRVPTFARAYLVDQEPLSVAAISQILYGDTTHAVDIMRNNRIENPMHVPIGTTIIYFVYPSNVIR